MNSSNCKYPKRHWCVVIILLPLLLQGQNNANQDSTYKNFFLPSPSITYSPETDFVFGAFALYQFKFKKDQASTRASYLQMYGSKSLKDQLTLRLDHKMFVPGEKWFFEGEYLYQRSSEKYYGLGHDTDDDDELHVDFNTISLQEKFYREVIDKKLFVGLMMKYVHMFDLRFTDSENNPVIKDFVPGGQGSRHFGLGLALLWDERNSLLTPTENHYIEMYSLRFFEELGNPKSYTSFRIDGRKYFNFNTGSRHVLAFQGIAHFTTGDVPFREMALIGGRYMMRGYTTGRYRDNHMLEAQTEYRFKVIGRFGMTTFVSVGNVMGDKRGWKWKDYKYAYGVGLRYNINKSDPANLRLDVGFGKDTQGVYITFGEAF